MFLGRMGGGLGMGLPRHASSSPAGFSFTNTEASDLVTRMSVEPDDTRKGLIDDLVGALKSGATSGSNIWAKLDGLYVLAAADKQAAFLNWKGGSFDITENGTGTFTADRGWAGDGTTGYLDTGFNPTNATTPNYTLNSAHVGLWCRTNSNTGASGNGRDFGVANSSNICINLRSTSDTLNFSINNSTGIGQAVILSGVTDCSGHTTVNRSGSGALQAYKAGVAVGSGTKASVGLPTADLLIGRGGSTTFTARQFSAAHIGSSLAANEVTDLYNALSAYMTTVGA